MKPNSKGQTISASLGLLFALILISASAQPTRAQWTSPSSGTTTTSDNVGIGTPSPGSINSNSPLNAGTKLQITGPATAANIAALIINGYDNSILALSSQNGTANQRLFMLMQQANRLDFNNYTDDGMSAVNIMSMLSSGNVGIGTTSPGVKFMVKGATDRNFAAYASSSMVYSAALTDNASSYVPFSIDGSTLTLQSQTGGTTAIMGRVGVGTASPQTPLHVNGSSGDTVNTAWFTTSSFTPNSFGSVLRIGHGASSGNTHAVIESFIAGGSAPGNLILNSTGGNIGIGTTNITAGYKLDVSGDLKVSGTGNINANGTIEASNIKAKYQDVAEWVPASEQLAAGTVVVLDSTKSNHVISSSASYDTRVAGVISEQPGIALGEKAESKVLVATTGRVKVKVDASKSPIQIGDLLVTSDMPGIAMKSEAVNLGGVQFHRPGTLIGKALEPLAKGGGEILVLLSLQ